MAATSSAPSAASPETLLEQPYNVEKTLRLFEEANIAAPRKESPVRLECDDQPGLSMVLQRFPPNCSCTDAIATGQSAPWCTARTANGIRT